MFERMRSHLTQQLQEIRDAGLEKPERVIGSPQGASNLGKAGRDPE